MIKKNLVKPPMQIVLFDYNESIIMSIWVTLSNTYSKDYKFDHARFIRKDLPFITFYDYLRVYNG